MAAPRPATGDTIDWRAVSVQYADSDDETGSDDEVGSDNEAGAAPAPYSQAAAGARWLSEA